MISGDIWYLMWEIISNENFIIGKSEDFPRGHWSTLPSHPPSETETHPTINPTPKPKRESGVIKALYSQS